VGDLQHVAFVGCRCQPIGLLAQGYVGASPGAETETSYRLPSLSAIEVPDARHRQPSQGYT
jgi:hypothetical protein